MRLIEKYIQVIRMAGLNTNKDAYFGGNVTIAGTLSAASESITAEIITSSSANAFAVGPNGTTNPTFNIDASTASAATGLNLKSAAAGAGVVLSTISSGTNENLTISAKGTGILILNNSSTQITSTGSFSTPGGIVAGSTVAITAGGSLAGLKVSSTSQFGLFGGSGAPTIVVAKGSIYMRSDGSSTSTRLYVATDSAGTWTPITTAT